MKKKDSTGELSNCRITGRLRKTSTADDQITLAIMRKNSQTPVRQIRDTFLGAAVDVSVAAVHRTGLRRLTCEMQTPTLLENRMARFLLVKSIDQWK